MDTIFVTKIAIWTFGFSSLCLSSPLTLSLFLSLSFTVCMLLPPHSFQLLSIFGAFTKGQHAYCIHSHTSRLSFLIWFFLPMFYFQLLKSLTNTAHSRFTFWNVTHAFNHSLVRWLSVGVSLIPFCQSRFCAWFLLWLFKLSFWFCFEIVFVGLMCIDFVPISHIHTHMLHSYVRLSVYICLSFLFSLSFCIVQTFSLCNLMLATVQKVHFVHFWCGNEDKLKIGRLKLRMKRWWRWFKKSI